MVQPFLLKNSRLLFASRSPSLLYHKLCPKKHTDWFPDLSSHRPTTSEVQHCFYGKQCDMKSQLRFKLLVWLQNTLRRRRPHSHQGKRLSLHHCSVSRKGNPIETECNKEPGYSHRLNQREVTTLQQRSGADPSPEYAHSAPNDSWDVPNGVSMLALT